jgi:hypothetical protein
MFCGTGPGKRVLNSQLLVRVGAVVVEVGLLDVLHPEIDAMNAKGRSREGMRLIGMFTDRVYA